MYKVLNGNLDIVHAPLKTERDALNLALHLNQEQDVPYYIEAKSGDLIALIYGGVVWLPSPDEAIHYIDKLD